MMSAGTTDAEAAGPVALQWGDAKAYASARVNIVVALALQCHPDVMRPDALQHGLGDPIGLAR